MIIRTPHGNDRQLRDATLGNLIQATGGSLRSVAGVSVTPHGMLGLAAANACIRVASQSVAKRRLAVWRGDGVDRIEVKATWQSRLFANPPNAYQSWFDLMEVTESCLTSRNNALWVKLRDAASGQVAGFELVHPDSIQARWNNELRKPEYRISAGADAQWLDQTSVVHFRVGYIDPTSVMAPSPIEVFRDMLESGLSKQRYEKALYERGLTLGAALVYPESVSEDQARRWANIQTSEHGGVQNAGKIRVFGGGATLTTIGLSLNDAQFIESMTFSNEDIARAFGVTASLIGAVAKNRGDQPITPEHEEIRWNRYGLEPRLLRIEQTIQRDPTIFGQGSRDFVMFAPSPVRGDIATESAMLVQEVQAGILTPDEARAFKGYKPLPDGAGAVPQMTPVGGAENPDLAEQLAAASSNGNGNGAVGVVAP